MSKQIDTFQRVELSYATLKEGSLVSPLILSKSPNMPLSCIEGTSNSNISMCSPNDINPSSIPYLINQFVEPNS